MKSIQRPLFLLLIFLGIIFIALGIIFTPDVVAKYIKHKDSLPNYTINKILLYQLYAVTAGCLIILLSAFFYNNKIAKYILLPVIFINLLLIHKVYINKIYPNNIFLKTSELIKPWRVLLGKEIILSDYQPKSSLVVNNRKISRARYPVIDMHFHLDSMVNISPEVLLKAMDACGVKTIMHLVDPPKAMEKYKRDFKDKYPNRFILFGSFNLHEIRDSNKKESDFANSQIAILENAVKMGASGMKVYKQFGLRIKDKSNRLVALDDPRYSPIWDKAGELGVPVMIHLGDPTPFFTPADRFNERYEELRDHPEISYYSPQFPTKGSLLSQAENLIKKHPRTIFIMAHMNCVPENLSYISSLMDKYPNYYVDTASIISELGRQPYTARKFFIKYQDRILFGSDGGYGLDPKGLWPVERFYRTYFEFFETSNEYFEYPMYGTYNQGRWRIYGIDLPNEVLEKIYHKNAEKLLLLKG